MSRRLRSAVLGLAVCAALAGAAIAHAAGSTTPKPSAPRSHPATGYQSMPTAHHSGNCPNMGGSSGSSSGSSAPSALGV
jgi:hypothetical protein